MKRKYFLLFVWGDVEPEVIGPFATEKEVDQAALKKRKEEGDQHGYYFMSVDGSLVPEVLSYSGAFFLNEDDNGS